MHDDATPTGNRDDEQRSLIDRREYLKATGASAAAFAGGLAATGTAIAAPTNTGSVTSSGTSMTDHGDYVEVTVGEGGEWICSLEDGDTLSNYLVDISANNANAQINPTGSGWTVENVGFRGESDDAGDFPKKHVTPLVSSGGTGTIRHLYMGDGSVSDSRKGAIWVKPDHAGELLIEEVYLAGWADNGLYGSPPGNGSDHSYPGKGGTVTVTDSYSGYNEISNFRLGTTGSSLENCVSEGGVHRSFWGYYEDTELQNCDLTGAPIVVGETDHDKGHYATVTADNCRYDVDVSLATSTNEFTGSSQESPDTTLPDGVPTSAEEAASGNESGGGPSGDQLEVVTADDTSDVSYTFDVYGTVSKVTDNGDSSTGSEDSDTISDNGDGTYTVEGVAGNGYGDTYDYDGNVFSWSSSHSASAYTLYRNETQVTADELTKDRFEIVAGDSASEMTYQFTVDGTISKVTDNGDDSAENNDTITDNGDGTYTVEGVAGNGYGDTFDYDGTRSNWSADHAESAYTLYTNGSETDPKDIGDGGSGETVLDDFEDGDISEYSGHTSAYQVQSSTVIEESNTLEATSSYGEIARADVTTQRGYEYRCRIQASTGSGSKPSLLACVQDEANAMQDAYWAFPNTSTDEFKLMRRDGGSSTTLDAVSYALQEGDEYEIALELGNDTVKAVLYDASGTIVVETAAVTDATYSGGTFGFYTGGGTPAYYDFVTETPLDSA